MNPLDPSPQHRSPLDRRLEGFPEVELRAMVLAGELARHGIPGFEFYLPIGMLPTAVERAASLLGIMRPGRTVTGRSARWVHVGGPAPREVEVSRRSGRMLRVDAPVRCRFRRLERSEVTTLAGLVLTTPMRTMRDLLREGFEEDARLLAAALEPAG
ncbi:hypothetical protein [Gulosibacter sp. 10]|uniref:hypothetical protein n=1 Tax=Gulosibacter sp. 10 TaxID=1255570 RepID=UPI00097F4190|nr:hypothetical protein [Gulosibacter sp. 10]SJM54015.1 hypothetical protein FM112_03355 [Gulosibacter sp. 10]